MTDTFCKLCGIKLQRLNLIEKQFMKEKPELKAIEFDDGFYCIGCSKHRMTASKDNLYKLLNI